jgi:hypothetical protein
MGLQPSASRTALLLACPRPFDPELEEDPDLPREPARYGTAFHAVLASCLRSPAKKPLERSDSYAKEVDRAATKNDVKHAAQELAGHVKSSAKVLRNWLTREKLEVAVVEQAYAVWPRENGLVTTRAIEPHDEDHRYKSAPGEVPGTVDLVALSSNRERAVVLDHKTGSGDEDKFAQPAEIPQMRTLGLVAPEIASLRGGVGAEVGIFHADRRGLPNVYAEPYDRDAQGRHAVQLHRALVQIGSGFLRPGAQCKYCPAKITCPAWAADLLAESTVALVSSANTLACEPIDPKALLALPDETASGAISLETRAGALYELLKKFRALDKAGTEEIRRLVRAGSIIETRDGKVLTIQTQTYETLSKKSVLEALGELEGEKELARLRKKGAIKEATRERLVGEK